MSRLAADHRVYFIEEPRFEQGPDRLEVTKAGSRVTVVVPVLSDERAHDPGERARAQRVLLETLLEAEDISNYVLWYYTPMALPVSADLTPVATIFDCMDDLTGFKGAPPELRALEAELLRRADVVLTGGRSLYEAKRHLHPNIHAFPSSIDVAHFAGARGPTEDPEDQAPIARPRIGFAGVIDERMDVELVRGVAEERPSWQVVLLGPVVKIDPATLPSSPNVHLLGMKPYAALPSYFGGWDVGILPFAHNAATRFISPTKTPEYLAAGLPVVATSIRDVVEPYGTKGLVRIADSVAAFIAAIEEALGEGRCARLAAVDALLSRGSWDETVRRMRSLMTRAIAGRGAGMLGHFVEAGETP